MQKRDKGARQALGLPLTTRIHNSRVLLVGAGGIGCEVLKNLVCCGFGSAQKDLQNGHGTKNGDVPHVPPPGITVVDLDTIDLSNLNRQFLFRTHHIKKPKAFVAKETASQYNPSVNIDAQHASVFDSQYNVDFFKGFDIVFNALDNLAARRHVNRMCLAADVPLIESGTTGYNGQVQAIRKGVTECYDCNPKPVQTSYPICTIRSTPSQPIHCIVWAKSYLLPELFGETGEEQDMKVTDDDNAEEVAKLQEEAQALKRVREKKGEDGFAKAVFDKVFGEDITRLRSMEDMWKSRKPPTALSFGTIVDDVAAAQAEGAKLANEDQSIWNVKENTAVFVSSLASLTSRTGLIEFDKDDKDTLDFVTAAANLRAHIFDIPTSSEWNVKQMAGNIIPAIATSNAMTASLCVLQSFKILRAALPKEVDPTSNGTKLAVPKATAPLGGAKMTFLTSKNADRTIVSEALRPPNPECAVCSPIYAQLSVPSESPTLQQLVDLLKKDIGYDEFAISTDAGIIYDPEEEDNLERTLASFGLEVSGNAFLTITDEADEPKVNLVLSIAATMGDELALLPERLDLPDKPLKPKENGVTEQPAAQGTKRKREEEDDGANKKAKPETSEEAIVIDDDGTILLDDD